MSQKHVSGTKSFPCMASWIKLAF